MKAKETLNILKTKSRFSMSGGIFLYLFICLTGFSQDSQKNLFKNSNLISDGSNTKVSAWGISSTFKIEQGYKGKNSVCITLDKKARTCYQSTMAQKVKNLAKGKYLCTAYVKCNRKISDLLLCRIIKQDGKNNYQTANLTKSEQEPGQWTKIMLELDIPEGVDFALFAFDLRDKSSGAKIWIDSPSLKYKAEQ